LAGKNLADLAIRYEFTDALSTNFFVASEKARGWA